MALIGRSDCHYQHQFGPVWKPTLRTRARGRSINGLKGPRTILSHLTHIRFPAERLVALQNSLRKVMAIRDGRIIHVQRFTGSALLPGFRIS
jgi:hypothetical protein